MAQESVWTTWKPYAVLAVIGVGGFWWWNTQSPLAALKDGTYACQGVYVNESNKYEVLVDDSGNRYEGSARVSGGVVVALSGNSALSPSDVASLTIRTNGNSHFHATDDPAMRMYYAIACDHAGQ